MRAKRAHPIRSVRPEVRCGVARLRVAKAAYPRRVAGDVARAPRAPPLAGHAACLPVYCALDAAGRSGADDVVGFTLERAGWGDEPCARAPREPADDPG